MKVKTRKTGRLELVPKRSVAEKPAPMHGIAEKFFGDRLGGFLRRRPFYLAGLLLAVLGLFLARASAEDAPRKVVAKTAPTYPELAKRMHVTGKVKLEVVVTASGAVKSARLVGGNPVFEQSAIEAVKQWRFEPAATETKTNVVLEFGDQ